MVVAHDVGGPAGLGGGALGAELGHVGLDVEDGGVVDGVQALDVQVEAVGLEEAAAGDADPVGAVEGIGCGAGPVAAEPGALVVLGIDRALQSMGR